jgi:hypothetical protein
MNSLGQRRILLLAVGELAGQAGDVERALAPRQLARLARGFAGAGGIDDLARRWPWLRCRVLQQEFGELLGDGGLDRGPSPRGDQLVLGLRGELRVRHLHRQHAVRPSRMSSPVVATFSRLSDAFFSM